MPKHKCNTNNKYTENQMSIDLLQSQRELKRVFSLFLLYLMSTAGNRVHSITALQAPPGVSDEYI